MARRNHSLVVTLLVMIAALIGAILWGGAPPTSDPSPSNPTVDLEPGSGPIVAAAPDEVVLRGLLVVDSEPMAGVEIGFEESRPFPLELFGSTEDSRQLVAADENGRFAIIVDRERGGRLVVEKSSGFLFADDEGQAIGELTVGGYSADHDLGTITLLRTAALSGRVVDSEGNIVVGAIVRTSSIGFESDPERGSTERTDEQGRFELAGLYPGAVRVRAECDGFRPLEQDVELAPGQSEDELELTLVSGLSITGRIVDDSGLPLPGVRVVAVASDGTELASTASGPFAFYELGGLEDGVVTVEASSPKHAPLQIRDLKTGTAGLRLRLQRLGRISGVLVGRDGRPISGSRVVARTLGSSLGEAELGAQEATTDEDGEFVLDDVVPGTLTLTATGEDHLPARSNAPITLRPGQSIEYLRIQAVRAASLSVDVVDLEGTRVADAEVFVEAVGRVIGVTSVGGESSSTPASRTRRIATARTGPEGRATFDQLPPAPLRLVARHRRFAPSAPVDIRLDPTDAKEVLLTVLPAGGLGLVVRTPAGVALAGLPLRVQPADASSPARRIETDADGRVVVDGLSPGTHKVEVLQPALDGEATIARTDPQPRNVEIVAGETAEVVFELPLRSELRGRVTGAEGAIADARVELRAEASDLRFEVNTDPQGAFVLTDLDPGAWSVEISVGEQPFPAVRRLPIPGGGSVVEGSFELEFGGLVVELVDDLDAGRAGVSLEFRPTDPTRVPAARQPIRSGADGVIRLASVPTGVYELRFSAPGLVPQRVADVVIAAGEVAEVPRVTLQRTATIRGGVEPEAWKAVTGNWTVQWRRAREDQGWESDGPRRGLDTDGRFELPDLEPGRYELRLVELLEDGVGKAGAIRTLDLAAGATEVTTLELPQD